MDYRIKLVALILLAVLMRAIPLAIYGTFYDENTMTAVLAVKQAVLYSHPVPDYLSGHPQMYAEQGIVWLALIAYDAVGRYIGLFATLYGVRILFTVLAGILVYKFAEKAMDRKAGFFALFVYAISQVGIFNEALNSWKGEAFSVIALMLALLLLLHLGDGLKSKKSSLWLGLISLICIVSLVFSVLVWSGGTYSIVAVAFVVLATCIYMVVEDKRRALAVIAVVVLVPMLLVIYTPLLAYAHVVVPTPQLSNLGQNIISMISQTQVNLFQSQQAWVTSPYYYVQLIVGIVLYLGLALYAIYTSRLTVTYSAASLAFIIIYAVFLLGIPFALAQQDWNVLIYLPISVLAGIGAKHVWENGSVKVKGAYVLLAMVYITLGIVQLTPTFTEILPAINYPYLYVVSWIAGNTAANSVFVTYPSYGTPIEYYADRTSLFDTNIVYNNSIQQEFLLFLALPAGNFSYLDYISPKPDYLLINTTWMISSPYYSFYNSNLALLESAPYSVISENISLNQVYDEHGYIIYRIGYGAITPTGPNTVAVCRSVQCSQ